MCYPTDNKCHVWHTLANGSPAPDGRMCQTGYSLGGKCAPRPTAKAEFIDKNTDFTQACKYSDNFTMPAMCIRYSQDPQKTGYCMDFANIPMTHYLDYVSKFTPGSCASGDIYCDKGIDSYGCPQIKPVMQESMYILTRPETLYPTQCWDQVVTNTINNYKCPSSFAKELAWGLVTVLAILLLI
jgi:hypothetical protein